MATIVNKIKDSVQRSTGLSCLYGSLDDINVQMEDQTRFPVAFFVLLNNSALDDTHGFNLERVDVAMFFVQPTEFDFESIQNEALIEECHNYAIRWLNSLYLYSGLKFVATLSTSRVYNEMDTILTGWAVRVRLEETVPHCIKSMYSLELNGDEGISGFSGAGMYPAFATATATAIAKHGFTFNGWKKHGIPYSEENPLDVLMDDDIALYATTKRNDYTVTVSGLEGISSTTGGGVFQYESEIQVTAEPMHGFHFDSWKIGGETVSESNPYILQVLDDTEIIATAGRNTYNVSLTEATPGTIDSFSGYGPHLYESAAVVSATPSHGYSFKRWTDGESEVSTLNPYSFIVTDDTTLFAECETVDYTVSVSGGLGIDSVSGSGTYPYRTVVPVSAVISRGFDFDGWYSNGVLMSTDNPYNLQVLDDTELVALTTRGSFDVTLTESLQGSVTSFSGAGRYPYETQVTASAEIAHGFTFSHWEEDGSTVSTSNPYTFELVDNTDLVAVCTRNNYTLTLLKDENITSVTGGGTYPYETQVTATAVVPHGFTFSNWTSNGEVVSESNPYSFSLSDNTELTANCTRNNYTVSLTSGAPGTIDSLNGGGTYPYETQVTVEAVPMSNYEFVKWTDGTSDVSTSNPYTFVLTDDTDLVAEAVRIARIEVVGTEGIVSVSGGGVYHIGDSVTISAVVDQHYDFANWTKDGQVVSTTRSYTFTASDSGVYVANAYPKAYTVTVGVNDSNMGTATGSGEYLYGQQCTVNSAAYTGHHFIDWTVQGVEVGTGSSYTFTVEGDISIQANFAVNTYTVTTAVDGNGTATGSGTYNYGSTATVSVVPDAHWAFSHWEVGGSSVSTSNPYSFTVTDDVTVTAVLDVETYNVTVNSTTGGSATGTGVYGYGSTATLVATPDAHYYFSHWEIGGQSVSSNPTYSFVVEENVTVTAVFEVITHTVTVNTSGNGTGTVTGSGTYAEGSNCTVTAAPAANSMFDGWYVGNTLVSQSLSYTFQVENDITITALFYIEPEYLRFTSEENGSTIKLKAFNGTRRIAPTVSLEYNRNDTGWYPYTVGTVFTLNTGEYVKFRGDNERFALDVANWSWFDGFNAFTPTGRIAASGNIMTILDHRGIQNYVPKAAFVRLFCGSSTSYADVVSITTAPELPATELSDSCYEAMFGGNDLLVSAPSLPAITLANGCYERMFSLCTALVSPPALPATALAAYCYAGMFYGCTSLVNPPALSAMNLEDNCYGGMFYGCTSLHAAPTLPATTLKEWCYNGMFHGCTSLGGTPTLPARTLVDQCYNGMFYGCSNLSKVKVYFTNWNVSSSTGSALSTSNWLSQVSQTGVFYCPSALDNYRPSYNRNNVHGIPWDWTRTSF